MYVQITKLIYLYKQKIKKFKRKPYLQSSMIDIQWGVEKYVFFLMTECGKEKEEKT